MIPQPHHSRPDNAVEPADLDWLAFCYAANELEPAEAQAFELRLATDVQAAEALVRAVELTEVVQLAVSRPPTASRPALGRERISLHPRGRILATLAAAAATVALYLAADGRFPLSVSRSSPSWSTESLQTWVNLDQVSAITPAEEEPALSLSMDGIAGPDDDRNELLPSWILELAALDEPSASSPETLEPAEAQP